MILTASSNQKSVPMLTIETWLQWLGRRRPADECPAWPPDLYAIAGALLKRSGAYLRVFEHDGSSDYLEDVKKVGDSWLKDLDKNVETG
jgi:hypothetical protein